MSRANVESILNVLEDSIGTIRVGDLDVPAHGSSGEVAPGFPSVPAVVSWFHGVRDGDRSFALA